MRRTWRMLAAVGPGVLAAVPGLAFGQSYGQSVQRALMMRGDQLLQQVQGPQAQPQARAPAVRGRSATAPAAPLAHGDMLRGTNAPTYRAANGASIRTNGAYEPD